MDVEVSQLPDIRGMTREEAQEALLGHGINVVRATSRDGKPLMTTRDYRLDRLNVAIVEGVISSVGRLG